MKIINAKKLKKGDLISIVSPSAGLGELFPHRIESGIKCLEKSCRHLQYLLMKKINIRQMPQIVFKIDRGLEAAANIEKLLIEAKIEE